MIFSKLYKLTIFIFTLSFVSVLASESGPFPYPIDIVYLWVDGKDPAWLECKECYREGEGLLDKSKLEGAQENRFSDHQELKYSLRSILKFAPFFNHVYIVTMSQRPEWLLDHPQITIIDHKDIFKDLSLLPTFNSQALECHLHRIPNLSEHFIYFNDDVFVGLPLTPYDFFTEDGKVKVLFEEGYTVSDNPVVQATLYRQAWVNSNALLDACFIPEKRHRLCHAPFALKKSWIEQVEDMFPFVFEENSSHRFRAATNYNVTNGLFQYIWYYQNRVVIGDLKNQMASMFNDLDLDRNKIALDELKNEPKHTFCIQDCMLGASDKTCKLLHDFMDSYLPDPAPWEILPAE